MENQKVLETRLKRELKEMFAAGIAPQDAVMELHKAYPKNTALITKVLMSMLSGGISHDEAVQLTKARHEAEVQNELDIANEEATKEGYTEEDTGISLREALENGECDCKAEDAPEYAFVDMNIPNMTAHFMTAMNKSSIEEYIRDQNDPATEVVVFRRDCILRPEPTPIVETKFDKTKPAD